MKFRATLFAGLTLFLLAGCFQNDVDVVKGGSMEGYPTTTVGAAFGASFNTPKWQAFKGDKGERVVEFSGKISQTLHDSYVKNILHSERLGITPEAYQIFAQTVLTESEYQQVYEGASGEGTTPQAELDKILLEAACKKLAPVGNSATFQWVINTDGETFSIAYIDFNAWGPLELQLPLAKVSLLDNNVSGVLDAIYD